MKLFGTDGVRGKAGEFLDVITVIKLAQAAGIYFRKHSTTNKILVGKDTRRSGYMIENALVSGLTSVGYNVIQIMIEIYIWSLGLEQVEMKLHFLLEICFVVICDMQKTITGKLKL